jgi:hypothetical protein
MNHNIAYIIKGSEIENNGKKEWIERITRSKSRAEKYKESLNKSLLEEIEKGREVFEIYLKDKENPNIKWEEMEFDTEKMSEKEFFYFCSYRFGTKLPFKIEEMIMS